MFEQKKKNKLEMLKKKQENELNALRVKLQTIFDEQMKEKNS